MSRFPQANLIADRDDVGRAYQRLAGSLQPYVDAGDCVLIGIMLGGMVPLVHLVELLEGDFAMDYCHVSRYGDALQGGTPKWVRAPELDLEGKTVALIDDIYDEGITLEFAAEACRALGARKILTAVLVRKRHDRNADRMPPDFAGLEVEDRYVFGSGMDYKFRWRHLSAIYALDE